MKSSKKKLGTLPKSKTSVKVSSMPSIPVPDNPVPVPEPPPPKASMSSDESKKEKTEPGILLDHDVGIVRLPQSWQETMNIVVGKTLGIEKQWVKVSAEPIVKEVYDKEDASVFHSYKEALQEYTLPDMYIGYNPLRTVDNEYLICTTHEGFQYMDEKINHENELLMNVGRMRVPQGWHSMGSEKEIEAARVFSTRLKMSIEIDATARLAKPRAPLVNAEPDAFELRPMSKEVFDLVERTLYDVSVQAVPRTFTVEAQTYTPFGRNAAVQSDPVEEIRSELVQAREEKLKEALEDRPEVVEDVLQALKTKIDIVLPHLKEESPPPIDRTSAGDIDEDTGQVLLGKENKKKKGKKKKKKVELFRGFEIAEEFVDVVSLGGKKIASVSWHPNYAGIIAVAYSKRVPTDSDPVIDAKTDIDDILGVTETLLSYEDSDTESMILPPIEKPNITEMGSASTPATGQDKVELGATIDKVESREQEIKKLRQSTIPARARLNKELRNNIDKYEKPDYKTMLDDGNEGEETISSMPWRDIVKKRVHYLDTLAANFRTIQSLDQEHVAGNVVIKMLENVLREDFEGRNITEEEEDEMGKHRRATPKLGSSGESSDTGGRNLKKFDPKKPPLSCLPKKTELQQMTNAFLPSNIEDIMHKRHETSKSIPIKRLAPSIRAAMNQHKKDNLFTLADTVLGKKKPPDCKPARDKCVGRTGKLVAEDPARDPMVGATHAVFLWSVTDKLMPALVLDSPDVVNVVEFCPHDGNIIAAGLECGLIALWDIKGRLETSLEVDGGNDVNSVRKSLERKLSWLKSLCSVRVVKPVVLSKRESSHLLPVIHLQWLHPLLRVSSTYDVHSVLELHAEKVKQGDIPKDSRPQLSYQLVSCSLYGKFHLWDCKPDAKDMPTPFHIRHNRELAETMLRNNPPTEEDDEQTPRWANLSRVWKPFLKVNPSSPQSTGLELPSYIISKFSVQQPPVVYKPSDKHVDGTVLDKYKIATDNFKLDFPFTMNLCTFDGRVCLAKWGAEKGGGIKWSSSHHDGVVTSLSSCRFYDKLKLTSGGREWCIWHNDYESGPILWKSYLCKVLSAIWSPFKPGGMFIGLEEGTVEVWDLLRSTIECLDKILCEEPPTVLSCSPHVSPSGCYLGVGDAKGKFQLWTIPMEHWKFSDDEVKRFRSLCDSQPARKRNNFEWSQSYRESHPDIIPVFDTLAREYKEKKTREKEELKREQEELERMWMSKKRVKKNERDDYEEQLNQMTEARQKKHYLAEAFQKKNIDKASMELARLPLDKKKQAERQIQENIQRKTKALVEGNEVEKELHRKLPLLKQMLENILATPPCLTSDSESQSHEMSKLSVKEVKEGEEHQEDGTLGTEPDTEDDLEYLISDIHNQELLDKVKQCEQDIINMPQSWVEILAQYDELRTWQNPWKPFLDVERWRQLLKQFQLKQKPPTEVEEKEEEEDEIAQSVSSVVSYGENEGEAEYNSQPTVFDAEPIEIVIGRSTPEELSLLSFREDPTDYSLPCLTKPNEAKTDDEHAKPNEAKTDDEHAEINLI